MRAVSSNFLSAVTGSHKMIARATVLTTKQFGLTPVGTVIPILDGDVKLSATADIKSTLDLTSDGQFWDQCQPAHGTEVYVERGVDYGNGTREFVGLGYFVITDIEQDNAPYGPIQISGSDRNYQMQQNRVLFPYQVPTLTSHRTIFNRLVNGVGGGYQMLINTGDSVGVGGIPAVNVPITWTSYDPDATLVPDGSVVQDSTYDFLADLAAQKGCVLRFNAEGKLFVLPTNVASSAPVYQIGGGKGGTMTKVSRSATRRDTYNMVSAYGSDPAFPTNYEVAYITDINNPLYWYGPFGAAPRYFASPLLKDDTAALSAANTILSRATGLPSALTTVSVPNPALEPLDVISVRISPTRTETHVIDEMTIPLTAAGEVEITTRTLNATESAS